MSEAFKLLVLGYGEMGHAMEYLLADRNTLFIWDKFPSAGFQSAVLEDSVPQADIILFCLPVNPHREVVQCIKPLLTKDSLCISIAKGLDENGHTAARIFEELLADQAFALLYGPMISEEIRAGRYAFAQVGCRDMQVYHRVHRLFAGTGLFTEYTSDIAGISWSVILKNVYAMVFGMADELRLGDNMRGFLMVAALHELEQIVMRMGGKQASPFHLAGLGDLVTTATSDNSHHHALGEMLARGETENIKGEGIHTLQMVSRHHLLDTEQYPLFRLIQEIVDKPVDVAGKIDAFLRRRYAGHQG